MRPIGWKILIGIVVLLLIGIGVYMLTSSEEEPTPAPVVEDTSPEKRTIGASVEGRDIETYTFGEGGTNLLFVGGVHGGYEWNSVLLAYEFVDYLTENPAAVPDTISVTVIPSLNPDGLYEVIGKEGRFTATDAPATREETVPGRFNANDVDLNRNFDCKWQSESMWRGNVVDAGTSAFSEPEAQALRGFVLADNPDAVVFWHSQSNAVYASECENGILAGTRDIMNAYAGGAGYPSVDSFDAYSITGDAEGWLASIGIPAITVELSTHEVIEWERNLAGVQALFALYAELE